MNRYNPSDLISNGQDKRLRETVWFPYSSGPWSQITIVLRENERVYCSFSPLIRVLGSLMSNFFLFQWSSTCTYNIMHQCQHFFCVSKHKISFKIPTTGNSCRHAKKLIGGIWYCIIVYPKKQSSLLKNRNVMLTLITTYTSIHHIPLFLNTSI
jgi:hypothetical protein